MEVGVSNLVFYAQSTNESWTFFSFFFVALKAEVYCFQSALGCYYDLSA